MGSRLLATIPKERLRPYAQLADSKNADVLDIYLWNQKVSLALFEDIVNVEVALRSAIAREMASEFGFTWFENDQILDSGALDLMRKTRLSKKILSSGPQEIHGKKVASMTLGFWVKLLGRGEFLVVRDPVTRKEIRRERRIYDQLIWKPAIYRAFPAANPLDRKRVQSLARDMLDARNRVAHHEHVIWGVPAVGQQSSDGLERRMALGDVQTSLLELASCMDADLKAWIQENSNLQKAIAACPFSDTSTLKL